MREILFKAKTTKKDNPKHEFSEKWVEGNLILCGEKAYIHPTSNKIRTTGEIARIIVLHEVIPNTICQYTGLTDKSGKRIWENDIISIHAYSYYEPEDDYFGVVTYCEKDACWSLYSEASDIICECFGSYTTEIINHGNIFDNPELLEVE